MPSRASPGIWVLELIKALRLERGLAVDEAVRHLYIEVWDALEAEPE